jgi:hypothetical protein
VSDHPSKARCCNCDAVTDYCEDLPEENQLCNQCSCEFAGVCDACDGLCRGLAWPKNCTHIYPRWPV